MGARNQSVDREQKEYCLDYEIGYSKRLWGLKGGNVNEAKGQSTVFMFAITNSQFMGHTLSSIVITYYLLLCCSYYYVHVTLRS